MKTVTTDQAHKYMIHGLKYEKQTSWKRAPWIHITFNNDLLDGGSSRPALSFIIIISVLNSISSQILLSLESATL